MKKLLFLALLTCVAPAYAKAEIVTRLLKDTTSTVALDLNEKTVFCTDRGYGNVQLKVSVPDLDWLAHFNHRVQGEGLPCITGGRCSDNLGPGDILDPKEPIAIVPVRVILVEKLNIDRNAKTCQRWLDEKVQSRIRGHDFNHSRGAMSTVKFEICEKLSDVNN